LHFERLFRMWVLFLPERFPVYKRGFLRSKLKLLHYRNGSFSKGETGYQPSEIKPFFSWPNL
ncbi:hypothetical protein, partial [Paenibacillus solanacearum]|uniref:hypothetical protein n=1 Tax=Paenibacillus solanacearum TaxID=2048548 RepID=UPI001C407124